MTACVWTPYIETMNFFLLLRFTRCRTLVLRLWLFFHANCSGVVLTERTQCFSDWNNHINTAAYTSTESPKPIFSSRLCINIETACSTSCVMIQAEGFGLFGCKVKKTQTFSWIDSKASINTDHEAIILSSIQEILLWKAIFRHCWKHGSGSAGPRRWVQAEIFQFVWI